MLHTVPQDTGPLQQQLDLILAEPFHGVINDDIRVSFQPCKYYVAPDALVATLHNAAWQPYSGQVMTAAAFESPGDIHFYEPAKGHRLPHDPLNAIIGPRPIGWISSQDADGLRNLAPYSFFNAFNYRPPILGFSSIGWKDTVRNIRATGEFVWNLATRALDTQMNVSSDMVPPETDEFDLSGLTPAPCRQVAACRVAESPVSMECRLIEIIQLKGMDGTPVPTWLVLGEVVGVHIARSALRNGVYDTAAQHPILRAGGPGAYAEITPAAMFDMPRPKRR